MAILYKADGTQQRLPGPLSLADLQHAVGGHIEVLPLAEAPQHRVVLVIDEEGKLKQRPVNRAATVLWWNLAPPGLVMDQIVGDALLAMVRFAGTTAETWE